MQANKRASLRQNTPGTPPITTPKTRDGNLKRLSANLTAGKVIGIDAATERSVNGGIGNGEIANQLVGKSDTAGGSIPEKGGGIEKRRKTAPVNNNSDSRGS